MNLIIVLRLFFLIYFGFRISRSDSISKKIPDKYTYPMIISGIVLSYLQFGVSLLLIKSYLIILGVYWFYVILSYILELTNKSQYLGGGDVKYSLAIASLIPFSQGLFWNIFIIKVIALAFILLFIMSIVKILSILVLGRLPTKLQSFIGSTIIQTEVIFGPILFISSILCLFV